MFFFIASFCDCGLYLYFVRFSCVLERNSSSDKNKIIHHLLYVRQILQVKPNGTMTGKRQLKLSTLFRKVKMFVFFFIYFFFFFVFFFFAFHFFASDWRPGGRGFNPRRGRQHSFTEIDHEIFSTVILSLPLIQEGQLSVSGERMCTILVNRLED